MALLLNSLKLVRGIRDTIPEGSILGRPAGAGPGPAVVLNQSHLSGLGIATVQQSSQQSAAGGGASGPAAAVVFTTDGAGGAPVVQHAKNVTGVSRTTTGEYTLSFGTPMADVNYVVSGSCRPTDFANTDFGVLGIDRSAGHGLHTGSLDIVCSTVSSFTFDPLWCSVVVFQI